MSKNYLNCLKLVVLAVVLPFVYGCGPGAGVSSLVGFLFGGGGLGGGEIALLGASSSSGVGALGAGGAGVASLVNPEPASMLLLGSGLVAAAYVRSKKDRHSK